MFDNNNTIKNQKQILRCAIYTRKSHEEGLEQEFNSLDAQRESAEAYIESQRLLGWKALPDRYDDGGFSGGSMERPALQRLLSDIDEGRIDIIVVYKIDRLSRSLLDFTRMVEIFNTKGVSFVAVTQQISTTDSTGRMMLNILMTFAQYEREVIGERIRDKVSAAKRRGKYCGGVPVLGYDVDRENLKLFINTTEAEMIRYIFRRYTQLGSAKKMVQELNEQGYKTKSWETKKGKPIPGIEWNTGRIYRLLNNRLYIGEIAYKDKNYPAEHDAIIEKNLWDKVQAILSENLNDKISISKVKIISPLSGVIRCGHCDCAMGITYAKKGKRHYTYYLCQKDTKRAVGCCPIKRVPAGDIETIVLQQLGAVFKTPTLVAKTYFSAIEIEEAEIKRLEQQKLELDNSMQKIRLQAIELASEQKVDKNMLLELNRQITELSPQIDNVTVKLKDSKKDKITEKNVSEAFQNIETIWEELFPNERNRLIRLLVEKIEIRESGIDMELKTNGLTGLVSELTGFNEEINERSRK